MKKNEANVTKLMPPLGPFPRYIWIHKDAPPDDFDQVCYRIWKRTQSLPDGLKPNRSEERVKEENDKDDVTRLVEQEYKDLLMDNLSDSLSITPVSESTDTDKDTQERKDQALKIEKFIKSVLDVKVSQGPTLPTKGKKTYSQDGFVEKKWEKTTKQDIIECSTTGALTLVEEHPEKTVQASNTTNDISKTTVNSDVVKANIAIDVGKAESQTKETRWQPSTYGKFRPKMEHFKQAKHPPGFPAMPYFGLFPGVTRCRPPGFMLAPPPSSVVAVAMNCSYRIDFPAPPFLGQYQCYNYKISREKLGNLFWCEGKIIP
ncbi:uncharacterized protein C1orf94 homolog [Hyperolius riggenbachi]|uniref:uncharacterized protein C1orf94 homolog n=1 Tax=Hyperolius riggenbachi TaxID=752182 RepID=UPI0035A2840C